MDGTLDFIRRKDSQLKIHGQRVEVGEIESHVTAADATVEHVSVTFVKKGLLSPRLIGILSFKHPESSTAHKIQSNSIRLVQDGRLDKSKDSLRRISEYMSAKLPRHMVPNIWIVIEGSSVPLTTSAKVDRRQITFWLENVDSQLVEEILALEDEEATPDGAAVSETEKTMRSIWGSVLNVEPHKIGLNRSFFTLGGDSVSATYVVSHCRARGLRINVQDIFRHKTINSLSALAEGKIDKSQPENIVQQSPISASTNKLPAVVLDYWSLGDSQSESSSLVTSHCLCPRLANHRGFVGSL